MTVIVIPLFGIVPIDRFLILIGECLIIGGIMLAYPIKWMNRSDVDNKTLEIEGAVLIGCGAGICGCVAYIIYVGGL
jgi:hypothetical protein